MTTECTGSPIRIQARGRRQISADFDGGNISSDAGVLLLKAADDRDHVLDQFAQCFRDHRSPKRIEHSVRDLVAQRVFALALGYEDLNDHDELRRDPLLASVVGKRDPTGSERDGASLAASSTLNRLELSQPGKARRHRYKRVELDGDAVDDLFLNLFVDSFGEPPEEIVLDFDATDAPLHGKQEGRFFHGYYGHYCYMPLYVFCGDHLLVARLRQSNIDGSAGTVEELEPLVRSIRQYWPGVRIIVRGDSGFCRDQIMTWCEANRVDYVLGVARNNRLENRIRRQLEEAKLLSEQAGMAARVFHEFRYRTKNTWSQRRRVIAKAEHLPKGSNPRFIVTSLPTARIDARELYEDVYCARGDMENRIKEQQLFCFADRVSAHEMRANQIRLYFSAMAYALLERVRRIGLHGTEFARAQCNTIRIKLLKIGAIVRVTTRKIWVAMSSAFPRQKILRLAIDRLEAG